MIWDLRNNQNFFPFFFNPLRICEEMTLMDNNFPAFSKTNRPISQNKNNVIACKGR